ncbi:MAG TPA: TlyA family RNA methyltransferase [Candidatus Lustribacter sp.]|jgi:23S rRNA (cytidine1920-2'-O)/16S rRNA (cytidine1409-2'-O)-methyltransferase|nr:TlyA family RNA methyltransferase [Candidatus Lustribacter sp.]
MMNAPTAKPRSSRRLDDVVAAQAELTRSQARGMILAGRVRVDGEPRTKPGQNVRAGAEVIVDVPARYVSRGGEKLSGALAAFAFDPAGLDVLDVGASTGGFTDVLLERGARSVVAVDVGYGQLAWKLRQDARVRVVERTNFRLLGDDAFPEGFDLIVVDASFISLRTIAARAVGYLRAGGTMIALVKPQFEAGRDRLGGGGVVRDPAVHAAVLREVRTALEALGMHAIDACVSPLRGPAGNVEFFYRIARDGTPVDDARIETLVAEANAA